MPTLGAGPEGSSRVVPVAPGALDLADAILVEAYRVAVQPSRCSYAAASCTTVIAAQSSRSAVRCACTTACRQARSWAMARLAPVQGRRVLALHLDERDEVAARTSARPAARPRWPTHRFHVAPTHVVVPSRGTTVGDLFRASGRRRWSDSPGSTGIPVRRGRKSRQDLTEARRLTPAPSRRPRRWSAPASPASAARAASAMARPGPPDRRDSGGRRRSRSP